MKLATTDLLHAAREAVLAHQQATLGDQWELRIPQESLKFAVAEEVGELVKSLGYHWWKPSQPDAANIHIELADIFFFDVMWEAAHCAYHYPQRYPEHAIEVPTRTLQRIEELTTGEVCGYMISKSVIDAQAAWLRLVDSVGASANEVLLVVVAKQVLNKLRHQAGYKEGQYLKQWCDALPTEATTPAYYEDNHFLTQYSNKLRHEVETVAEFQEELEFALQTHYAMVLEARAGAGNK